MRGSRGCSLLEVLVATSLVAVGLVAVAQLVALGSNANRLSRQTTVAAVLAQQKMEELVAEADAGLTESPAGALEGNVAGFFDTIDGAFVRRWSIEPLPASPNNTVVLQVLVVDARNARAVKARVVSARARRGL
jgi:type II secretory pathway pseudopilin PulG